MGPWVGGASRRANQPGLSDHEKSDRCGLQLENKVGLRGKSCCREELFYTLKGQREEPSRNRESQSEAKEGHSRHKRRSQLETGRGRV